MNEKVNYWLDLARYDLDTAKAMLDTKRYLYVGFMCHQTIEKGLKDAVEFGPFLIVNGKSSKVKGNGGMGVANRTAIAQRKDGIVLFLVIDGRGANNSKGISIEDMIKLLERYKAYNAANLDGGGSSTLVINHKLINNPKGFYGDEYQRYLPNAWIVK